jgi:membrane-associated phospholipid phosphatase
MREERRRRRFREVLEQATLLELAALVAAIVSVVLFGVLARAVLRAEVADFNRDVMLAIHRHASPTLDAIALAITQLGSAPTVVVVGALLAWLLRRAGRRIDVWVLASVIIGGGILSFALKTAFGQPRPDVFEPLYHPAGLSFPSGHSLISYCLWGFVAVWLVATNARSPWRWLGAIGCIAIATTVAATRLYIGVHWPSDVVAGLLVAGFWLATCFIVRQFVRTRLARRADTEPASP